MAQEALQSVGVASISQEVNGEFVAEAVDMGVGDTSAPAQADDEKACEKVIWIRICGLWLQKAGQQFVQSAVRFSPHHL
jgi:hypothetical protein